METQNLYLQSFRCLKEVAFKGGEKLCKLGIQCNNHSLCYYQNNNILDGILISHVDDICWGGIENFKDNIIRPLKNIFSIGTEFEQSLGILV